MKTEQKRKYERPTMRVVELQQHAHLLAGSLTEGAQMNVTYEEEDW